MSKSRNQRRKKAREWLRKYKLSCSCAICNESHIACLEFHHRSDKKTTISDLASRGKSIEEIQKEIAKCTVLCANCHKKIHFR